MGTFIGHMLPGTFFFVYGAWITYNVFRRYFLSQRAAPSRENGGHYTSYRNTNTFPISCCPKIPLEGILKVTFTSVAFIGELITGFRGGAFVNYENAHHMTMYFFFGLSGVFDILVNRGLRAPPNMDYVANILAFVVEGLLFGYHLSNRTKMDVQVHMLLLNIIIICAVSSMLEVKYKRNVIPALMRSYGLLLQGTWFVQIGFILYKPLTTPWDQNGPRHMMLITLIYCWHLAVVFLLMMLGGWVIHRLVKKVPMTLIYYELRTRVAETESRVEKVSREEIRDIIADSEEEEV